MVRHGYTQEKPVQRTLSGRPKRKRCKNCGDLFPITKPNREFCSDNCRKDFHRNGGAHMKVLQTIRKELPGLIREAFKKPPRELVEGVVREIRNRRVIDPCEIKPGERYRPIMAP